MNACQESGTIEVKIGAENIPINSVDYASDHKSEDFSMNASTVSKKACFKPTCKRTLYVHVYYTI